MSIRGEKVTAKHRGEITQNNAGLRQLEPDIQGRQVVLQCASILW